MKWILIMTLIIDGGYGKAVSIHSVEFNREDDCERAAITWIETQRKKHMATASCVEKHR